jgi:nucleoside-diphosphate-sugar epimerase
MSKTIAVTGAGGYIGSVLVGRLLDAGYRVRALDRFYFGASTLGRYAGHPGLELKTIDIRDLGPREYEGCWGAIDLSGLSNDPSAEVDLRLTWEINEKGRIDLAHSARSAGVERYVFSGSCSVYGAGGDVALGEDCDLNPLTAYARAAATAEEAIRAMNRPGFTTVALRNATVFGLSPRMRFDLVVNVMTMSAFERGQIVVTGGGQQRRPVVHVQDVARAFMRALEAGSGTVGGEVFNIGLANFRMIELSKEVSRAMPTPVKVQFAPGDADKRDYAVRFDKAKEVLGFSASDGVSVGVVEIHRALQAGQVERGLVTKTVAWYRHLIKMQRVLDYGLVARTGTTPAAAEAFPVAARQAELQGAGRAGLAAAEKTSVGRALLSIASMIAMLFGIETEYSEDSYVLSDRAPGLARAFESVMAVVA